MKKHRSTPVLIMALALAIGGAALTGCAAPQNNNDEVIAKLDEMQAQIDELEASQSATDAADDAAAADSANAADDTTKTDDAAQKDSAAKSAASSVDDFTVQMEDLAKRADDAAATAGKVAVPSSAADRPQAYFDAKAPLESLEHELDVLDDAIEAAYAQGSITREDVWTLEQREDAIDDVLDRAEDDLELRMGVDD